MFGLPPPLVFSSNYLMGLLIKDEISIPKKSGYLRA
jgi:hypothetical protein